MIRHNQSIDLKISGYQQQWLRPLPGAILIPPALLVVADWKKILKRIDLPFIVSRDINNIELYE
jgi:hypothetical protein